TGHVGEVRERVSRDQTVRRVVVGPCDRVEDREQAKEHRRGAEGANRPPPRHRRGGGRFAPSATVAEWRDRTAEEREAARLERERRRAAAASSDDQAAS